MYEETLKQAFVEAFSSLIENKAEIFDGYGAVIKVLTDSTALDAERKTLQEECGVVMELMRKCVEENAHSAIEQTDYQSRYSTLLERYETVKSRLKEVNEDRQERKVKRENIFQFLYVLKNSDTLLGEFDEELWHATVDRVIATPRHEITFRFKNSTELLWTI